MTTNELDKIALDVITQNNATPTFLNYGGFPKNICISINEELIHGIPSSRKIKNGDMITFDVGVTYMKYICDSAFTVILGINKEAQKINDATYECLIESIKEIKPDNVTGDISNKIENIAKTNHYEVIKDYSGHGCGIKLHEDPQISCFGDKHSGTKLKPGMILCIEPMLMTDSDEYYTESNNTVVARNHKLTCH
jgi:methionyl aminopeptidase